MIAPIPQNNDFGQGSFDQPIARTASVVWTDDEYRGLQRMAGFESISNAVRKLIGRQQLEQLALNGSRRSTVEDN
jgi:predicted CopG family antitoxin